LYAAFRPKSPSELFTYLASLVSHKDLAWDVGTGSGQAAIELAPHFTKVVATDASAEQIRHAVSHPKVIYRIEPAEKSSFGVGTVNLVTAAQAVHWFNFEKFYAEVQRVSASDAVIAVWTYELSVIAPDVDRLVRRYYEVDVGRFWPPERQWVSAHYTTIPFPFREIKAPAFEMIAKRNFTEWCGYLYTWSATQKAISEVGPEVFDNFVTELGKLWGDPKSQRAIKWPLYLRVGHVY